MDEVIINVQAPQTRLSFAVYRDEDWTDTFTIYEGDTPYPALVDTRIDFFIRPTPDHDTLWLRVSTDIATILFTTPASITLNVSRAEVQEIPIGTWSIVGVLFDGAGTRELFRGEIKVFGGRYGD